MLSQLSSQAGSGEQGSGRRAPQASSFDPFSCTSEVLAIFTFFHPDACANVLAAVCFQHPDPTCALRTREVVTFPPAFALDYWRGSRCATEVLNHVPSFATAPPQVGNATERCERPDNPYTRVEIKGNWMWGGMTSEHGEGRAGATRTRMHGTTKTSSQLPERAWAPELTIATSNKANTQTIAKDGRMTTKPANLQAASGCAPCGSREGHGTATERQVFPSAPRESALSCALVRAR